MLFPLGFEDSCLILIRQVSLIIIHGLSIEDLLEMLPPVRGW